MAVGFYHTAALKNDGTVLACGDDSFGQCQVSAWHSVKQICAGAYHTVGLLEDGTVIAAGRNDEGQCDVGDWRDIVAVTAADVRPFHSMAAHREKGAKEGDSVVIGDMEFDFIE